MAIMVSAKHTIHTRCLTVGPLEVNLLGLQESLEYGKADPRREIICERIDVDIGNPARQAHIQASNRIPVGSQCTSQGMATYAFCYVPRDPAESVGRLCRNPAQRHVVVHGLGFGRTNVTNGIASEGISVVGLGVDSEGQNVSFKGAKPPLG